MTMTATMLSVLIPLQVKTANTLVYNAYRQFQPTFVPQIKLEKAQVVKAVLSATLCCTVCPGVGQRLIWLWNQFKHLLTHEPADSSNLAKFWTLLFKSTSLKLAYKRLACSYRRLGNTTELPVYSRIALGASRCTLLALLLYKLKN